MWNGSKCTVCITGSSDLSGVSGFVSKLLYFFIKTTLAVLMESGAYLSDVNSSGVQFLKLNYNCETWLWDRSNSKLIEEGLTSDLFCIKKYTSEKWFEHNAAQKRKKP